MTAFVFQFEKAKELMADAKLGKLNLFFHIIVLRNGLPGIMKVKIIVDRILKKTFDTLL